MMSPGGSIPERALLVSTAIAARARRPCKGGRNLRLIVNHDAQSKGDSEPNEHHGDSLRYQDPHMAADRGTDRSAHRDRYASDR